MPVTYVPAEPNTALENEKSPRFEIDSLRRRKFRVERSTPGQYAALIPAIGSDDPTDPDYVVEKITILRVDAAFVEFLIAYISTNIAHYPFDKFRYRVELEQLHLARHPNYNTATPAPPNGDGQKPRFWLGRPTVDGTLKGTPDPFNGRPSLKVGQVTVEGGNYVLKDTDLKAARHFLAPYMVGTRHYFSAIEPDYSDCPRRTDPLTEGCIDSSVPVWWTNPNSLLMGASVEDIMPAGVATPIYEIVEEYRFYPPVVWPQVDADIYP